MTDVVIVGAGPVGSTFASLISPDLDTILLEEHANVGHPVQCTGLVAPRVVEMVGAESSVINSITGMLMEFPDGSTLNIDSSETKAVVIDRSAFDRRCNQRAIDAGAKLVTGAKFTSFHRVGKKIEVEAREKNGKICFRSDLLVGADGYKSKVAKAAHIGNAKEIVRGIQVDLEAETEEQHKIRMYLGREVAPGFFAWMIPCGSFTRVGLCVSKGHGPPSKYLSTLIDRLGLKDAKRMNLISGAIPIGPPAKTYDENILIIGDAAAQTKPLSGGGLFTGMKAAHCAAMIANQAHQSRDFSADFLSRYQVCWKEDIGKELERGYRVRRVFVRLSDKKLNEIGRMLNREDVKKILSEADIDFPMRLAPSLLGSIPSLIKLSPEILSSLIWRDKE